MKQKVKIPALIFSVNSSGVFQNRSLCELNGKTILQHIKERLRLSRYVGDIMLCTSDENIDDSLSKHALDIGIKVIRGKRDNIISRLYQAFVKLKNERAFIIRGDVPFIDYEYCDMLYEFHHANKNEYSYNEHVFGLPYGLGSEIVEKSAVIRLKKSRVPPIYQQKLGFYIRLNEDKFKIGKMDYTNPKPDLRFAVENSNDYVFAKELVSLTVDYALSEELIRCILKHNYLNYINRPISTAKEISLEKLLVFPGKINAIVLGNVDKTYPISVELSLTNQCNQKCVWCSDRNIRNKRPGSIPFDIFKSLVMDLSMHGTHGLVIEGGGEPTLYPQFEQAIAFSLEAKLSVGLITNGIIFNYRELVPKMEWIRISLDADTRDTYKKCKGKDSFYTVLRNIKEMAATKRKCVIGVGYVVTKYNIRHIEEITMLLSDYGVDYLYLRPVIDYPDMSIKESLSYLKKYESSDFSVMIQAMDENIIRGNNGLSCRSHSLSSVITADGSVFICGRLNIHDWVKPIGNINDDCFYNIWNGKQRLKQSEQVLEPSFCRKWCPECRLTKYNIVFDGVSKIKTRNFI